MHPPWALEVTTLKVPQLVGIGTPLAGFWP
jgi:hypothetical protein